MTSVPWASSISINKRSCYLFTSCSAQEDFQTPDTTCSFCWACLGLQEEVELGNVSTSWVDIFLKTEVTLVQTEFTSKIQLAPDVNEVTGSFHYLPHTSGAERDAAPSPSPQRFQPRWSRCGSSRAAWRALASPSLSLYWYSREDKSLNGCTSLLHVSNFVCRFVFHNVLCVQKLLQPSWRVQAKLVHIPSSVWSIIQYTIMS